MDMSKLRCKWLGLTAASLATLFVMGGCGGGGSSSNTPLPVVAKAAVSGTVSFPALGSLVGKQVIKSVAKVYEKPTVQLRNLSGVLVATATVTGTGTTLDPFSYTFSNVDFGADYVVKAFTTTNVIKAVVDKNSLLPATTRNIDTVSTTAVIMTEKKIFQTSGTTGTLGSLGDTANAAFTTTAIAAVNPVNVESTINTAIGTVNTAPGSAVQADIDLINIVNVVAAAVYNDVDPAKFIAGTVTSPPALSTTQFTTANVATGGTNTAIVQSSVAATLATSTTAYTPPPADSVTFTSRVMDYSTATAAAIPGVEVTANGLKTYTDASGFYTLAGITKNTTFSVKMSKAGYADSYSAQLNISANSNSSTRPYSLYPTSRLAVWGNFSGSSVITARVVDSTNLETGYIAGAVVTATDAADSTVYPVTYNMNTTTGAFDPTLTSTAANGSWMFRNVPAGRTVVVTATKTGYTFAPRTFVTVADSVCQGRITGTAVAVPPTTTSATKTALQVGLYELNSDSSWNGTTNTNYWYIDRINIAADGISLQQTILAYLDPNTSPKSWTLTVPVGFPVYSNSDYRLNSSGSWLVRNDGPSDMNVAFNADGSARLTSKTTSSVADVTITPVDITGQTISSIAAYLYGLPTLSTAATFPAGSVRYDMVWNQLTDDYSIWDTYGNSLGTTDADLSIIPDKFLVGTGMQVYIDSNTADSYYAQFVSAVSNVVNIYQYGVTSPIGSGTYVISPVFGRQIGEINIPSQLRTQYQLGNNPIFALGPNSYIMRGDHSVPGISYSNGGNTFNSTAVNHLKTYMDTAVAKPALAKKLSKAILGR